MFLAFGEETSSLGGKSEYFLAPEKKANRQIQRAGQGLSVWKARNYLSDLSLLVSANEPHHGMKQGYQRSPLDEWL